MTINEAYDVIRAQKKSLKRINDTRCTHGEFEYRLRYVGGISEFFCIERREIGRTKFRYFRGFSAWRMPTCEAVAQYIYKLFNKGGIPCTTQRTK